MTIAQESRLTNYVAISKQFNVLYAIMHNNYHHFVCMLMTTDKV